MNGSVKTKINSLRNECFTLEEQQDRLIWVRKKAGGSPFVIYGSLFMGFIGAGLSAVWIIHIFVYNTFKINPFLNTMMISLDSVFSLLGVIVYAVFTFYLLWATFLGQMKIGMRLLFFQIHPMKKGDTTVNSLLFNCILVLLSSIAVVQFCSMSFEDYAANTSISALINTFVVNLEGIGVVISYLQFCFVGVAVLSIFWVICCPKKKRKKDPLQRKKDDE
jgi:LMBR1 domain-containing protein 1